ncbi:MAG TPA: terminase TerL endonuclease subunit, partial [Thalassobaculum sp.]
SEIVELVERILTLDLLAAVAVDPAGLGELVDALDDIGVTQEADLLIGAPQGYAMMTAIKTAERRLAKGTLLHAGGQLMAWTVGNLKIEPTATAIRAAKANAGDAKIDVAMALFNAVTVMSTNPEPKRRGSYLENDEIIVL